MSELMDDSCKVHNSRLIIFVFRIHLCGKQTGGQTPQTAEAMETQAVN